MSDRTSIPVWKQTHRALKPYKPDDMNWPEFMALVAEDFQDGDTSTMLDEKLNSSESTSEIDLTPVLNRLDDLESNLPRKVREELR